MGRLRRVLRAYAMRNSAVGYCQGMNFACGSLLLVFKSEEDAYWGLVALVESLFPEYYEAMVLGSIVDQAVLGEVLEASLPEVTRRLAVLGLDLPVVTTHWFNSLFVEVVPFETLQRIFDALLADGRLALLKIALAFLRRHEELITAASSFEEVLMGLRRELLTTYDAAAVLAAAYEPGASTLSWKFLAERGEARREELKCNAAAHGSPMWRPGSSGASRTVEGLGAEGEDGTTMESLKRRASKGLEGTRYALEAGAQKLRDMDSQYKVSDRATAAATSAWGGLSGMIGWLGGRKDEAGPAAEDDIMRRVGHRGSRETPHTVAVYSHTRARSSPTPSCVS